MKTAPAGSWRPRTLNWLNQSKFCQETQLLPMVFLRWLSSWFLISKRNTQLHRKETLDLAIHSSFLKAPHDRGCLRVNQVLSRELKVKSPPWLPPPHQHVLEGNAFIGQWASNIKKIWHDKLKADMTSALTDSPRAVSYTHLTLPTIYSV